MDNSEVFRGLLFYCGFNILFFKAPPPSTDSPSVPGDTVVTLDIEEQDIPVLLSRLVQDSQVLDHPQVQQTNPLPVVERDRELDLELVLPFGSHVESDPNEISDENHLLRPLAARASMRENQETVIKLLYILHVS